MKAMLSTFTPSLMPPETLEAIFVQRHELADHLVGLIRDSANSGSKNQVLLIGPRGIGKTHMVSLVFHRIAAIPELRDQLLIAWLREEEWGVTTFRDLLIRILKTLAQERNDAELQKRIDDLYQHEPEAVEHLAARLLAEHVAGRTLLLMVENLDAIFDALGEEGQHRLRAYVQENPFFTILATSQSLFAGVQLRTSPFYGFFSIHHLEELTFEQAAELLARIADLDEDRELADCIRTPTGRARIRAVHHLGGGNHRVYVIFSQLLTRQTLDELVEAVMQMIEKLTPYYQARMGSLSPQQRQIVEFLCDRRGAAPVKDIARHCFTTSQTVSSALGVLGELGYVRAHRVGRESYYELREPLMRICIEVKKQRGQPVRLLVDFLRIWYTREELEERLRACGSSATFDRDYLLAAMDSLAAERQDPRVAACLADFGSLLADGDLPAALQAAEELVAVKGDAQAWGLHGGVLLMLARNADALASLDRALETDRKDAGAWSNRGVALGNLGRYEEALQAYDKALEIDPKDTGTWTNRGVALDKLGRYEEALQACDKALEIDPKDTGTWTNRGVALGRLGRYEEALQAFDKALEIDAENAPAWLGRGLGLTSTGRYEEALQAFDKALEIDSGLAIAWSTRGVALISLGRYEEALQACDKALEIDPKGAIAWTNRGVALGNLGRYEEALQAFDKALELGPSRAARVIPVAMNFLLRERQPGHDAAADWIGRWKARAGDREEFRVPLRLAEAAVRYAAEEDERILLELPVEERRIVREMLGLDGEEGQEANGQAKQ